MQCVRCQRMECRDLAVEEVLDCFGNGSNKHNPVLGLKALPKHDVFNLSSTLNDQFKSSRLHASCSNNDSECSHNPSVSQVGPRGAYAPRCCNLLSANQDPWNQQGTT